MAADTGPKWQLQVAIVAALRASDDIKALLGTTPRIYEDVQEKPVFPYVTLGGGQIIPDRAECIDGVEVFPDFHIWSRKSSFVETATIAATMLAVITAAPLTMDNYSLVDCYLSSQHDMNDPDGVTRHTVLTLKASIEPI